MNFTFASVRITFVILFSILSCVLFAQDTIPKTRGYFGIAAGVGFPLGDFMAKEFNSNKAGFANAGSNLQINFSYNILKNTAVRVRANINTNPYDVYELAKSYNFRDTFNDITYSVNSKNWYCIGGMVGLNYTIPIHRFGVEMHVFAGYQYAESPLVKTTLSNGTDSSTIKISSGSSSGIVWTTGIAGYYQISERISVVAAFEYYNYKGTFKGSQVMVDDKPINKLNDFDMDIRILNCTAGLRYHF